MKEEQKDFPGVIVMAKNGPPISNPLQQFILARRNIDAFVAGISSDKPVAISSYDGSIFLVDPNKGVIGENLSPEMEKALRQQKQSRRLLSIYYERENRCFGLLGKIRRTIEDTFIQLKTDRKIYIDQNGFVIKSERNNSSVLFPQLCSDFLDKF